MGATAHSVQIQMQLKSIQGETNQIENIHRFGYKLAVKIDQCIMFSSSYTTYILYNK